MNDRIRTGLLSATLAFFFAASVVMADPSPHPQPGAGSFATPLTSDMIDPAAAAEWVGGREQPVADLAALRKLLWLRDTSPTGTAPYAYGKSTEPGIRSLRIGFQAELPVGSVMVRGSDQLSVLRSGVPYPGNLGNDAQWIPAQRVLDHQLASAEVPSDGYALWVLPPGTRTRAFRFTHTATLTDSSFAGSFGGFYILSARYDNLAPDATITTSANASAAPLLVDLKNNQWWHTWDNGPTFSRPVTTSTPEWITLTWPAPVQISGLAALWAGFNAADTEIFIGPASAQPASAPAALWQPIGSHYTLRTQYPRWFGIDWLDFGKTVTTRAIRLRITAPTDESHSHLIGKTKNGSRVWLGELMALSPLNTTALQAAVAATPVVAKPHPPIPIHFTLSAPGYVTLVIDDAKGNRVRNLISDTLFPAGANTAWWDGSDDLNRSPDHAVDSIPTHLVAPGRYTARGIVHSAIDLRYEFTAYSAGSPPWEAASVNSVSHGSGWLTNHTPGSAALFVPGDRAITGSQPLIYLGSFISEGGSALAWVDLDGHKQGGRGWIGGDWTGAPYMARDTSAGPDHSIYVASVFANLKDLSPTSPMQLRITALTTHGDRSVLNYSFTGGGTRQPYDPKAWNITRSNAVMDQLAGLSVRNGVAVVSLAMRNEIVLVNLVAGKVMGLMQLQDPRGSVFDAQGNLYVLSGKRLMCYRAPVGGVNPQMTPQALGAPDVVIGSGLEDPVGIALDGSSIYISDRGASNQVKVFSMQGRLEHAIGHAGQLALGPYDPLHMNNPRGITIDSNQHLWVAEEDFQPKRISVWTLDGKLVNAFYGPPEYGGGGVLDPTDKTKFYYHQIEFHLDWSTGKSSVAAVLYRQRPGDLAPPPRAGQATDVLYSNGHRYFTNSFHAQDAFGATTAMLYLDEGGILHPVAALGRANDWPVLAGAAFHSKLPAGADLSQTAANRSVLFTWSDRNDNGQVDPDEVSFANEVTGSFTIQAGQNGPVVLASYISGKAMSYAPIRLLPNGIPIYDLAHGTTISNAAQIPVSDGGGQIITSAQATVLTTAPKPFPAASLGGFDAQGHAWSYPSLWPGLHASHTAPIADHPGELIGTTHLLGGFIPAPAPGIGDLWAINGNLGPMYLFTSDGLFVTQFFQDVRTGKPWGMPLAPRNMLLNDISPHDENFYPSLNATKEGNVYLVDGDRSSLVRVDGLNTLKRLPDVPVEVSAAELSAAQSFSVASAAAHPQSVGPLSLKVTISSGGAPALHNLSSALASSNWATIDHEASAAVAIAAGHLYAAFRTGDPNLLQNAGDVPNAPFKSGGALDLMIGADPSANPDRKDPVAGDLRLLVYQVNGRTHATLYRPVVKGTTNPVPFSSPSRTITVDQIQDVSNQVQLDASNGVYSIAVPLTVLGLTPRAGESIKADIGILRGNGRQTTQRVYWSNKATGITSDVPSEAALTPNLWGIWVFQPAP